MPAEMWELAAARAGIKDVTLHSMRTPFIRQRGGTGLQPKEGQDRLSNSGTRTATMSGRAHRWAIVHPKRRPNAHPSHHWISSPRCTSSATECENSKILEMHGSRRRTQLCSGGAGFWMPQSDEHLYYQTPIVRRINRKLRRWVTRCGSDCRPKSLRYSSPLDHRFDCRQQT